MRLLSLSYFRQKYIWLKSCKSPQYKIPRQEFQWKPSCSWRKEGRTDVTKLLISFSTRFRTGTNTSNFFCADYEVISGVELYGTSIHFNPGTRRK
jgi:hypothetical protein